MSNWLALAGVKSTDYGIILTAPPPRVVPERDVTVVSVPGRSGDLTIDNKRYKNCTVSCKCAIIPNRGETLRQAVTAALEFLTPTAGYKRLETSYDASIYMMARISGATSVESIVEQAGRFTLKLDCKPQRYLIAGDAAIQPTSGETLPNPTNQDAYPLLRIVADVGGALAIGGRSMLIQIAPGEDVVGGSAELWYDSELQEAWAYISGEKRNANSWVSASQPPVIAPGGSVITFSSGISTLEIFPRWWQS